MEDDGRDHVRNTGWLRRWFLIGGLLLVVLVLLIGALPWIVSQTPLKQTIIPRLLPEFTGTSHISAARLGWFSTIELEDVHLTDAQHQTLLKGGHLSVDRTLLELLLRGIDDATVRFSDASIDLVFLEHGSNWEEAVRPLFAKKSSTEPLPAVNLQIVDAAIQISDADGNVHGKISQWTLSGRYRPEEEPPLTMESSALVSGQKANGGAGRFSVVLRATPPGRPEEQGSGEMALQTESLAFGDFAPLVARFAPDASVSGTTTADVTIDWLGKKTRLEGQIQGRGLTIRSEKWMPGDALALESCNAVLNLDFDGEQLQINRFRIASDLANLELETSLQIDQDVKVGWRDFLGQNNVRVSGEVDLARLAAQLPSILRIRQDAQVTSGRVTFSVQNTLEENLQRWDASLKANGIEALAAGKLIRWQQPVTMSLSAAERPDRRIVGNLNFDCDYLSLEADGSIAEATIAARGDLTRLAADLNPLIDLQGLHLAGRFDASVDLQRQGKDQFDANGHVLVQGLEFWFPGWRPVREDRITLSLQTKGELREGKSPLFQEAILRMNSAQDQLQISLGGPISATTLLTGLPVVVQANGELASWMVRLQTWLPSSDWQLQGTTQLTLNGNIGLAGVDVKTAKAQIDKLRIVSPSHVIEESSVIATASGKWDRVNHTVTTGAVALRLPSAVFWTEKLLIDLPSPARSGPAAKGDLFVRADLKKLQGWITNRQAAPQSLLAGQMEGKVRLDTRDESTVAGCNLVVKNFEFSVPAQSAASASVAENPQSRPRIQAVRWKPIWKEREFAINGRGRYVPQEDRISLDDLQVESGPLGLIQTSGTFSQLTTTPSADINGRLKYDLSQIAALLRPYLGQDLHLKGSGNQPFFFRGHLPPSGRSDSSNNPPWWVDANAGAGFAWDALDLYGLRTGKGEVRATLAQGVVRFKPIDLSFSSGRLKTTPWIRLSDDPQALFLSKDTRLEHVMLTEELCQQWLQFLAPVLAQATRAQGQFSLTLPHSMIPLKDRKKSELAGSLIIHSAQVSPGPLTAQIAAIAAQVDAIIKRRPGVRPESTTLKITPQTIPFRVADGRVEHQNFQIEIGDVIVRTSGYVGFDQSLSLVAEIPIRDKWVQRDKFLRGLKGQTLKIPISGTLNKPQLDKRIIAWLGQQMIGSAAGGLLEDALDRGLQQGLDKLFR